MYLWQAISLQPLVGTESDLFHHTHLMEEVQSEPALVTGRLAVSHVLAVPPAIAANAQGRNQTFAEEDRSGPPSLVIRVGPWT
jgi:hypothetical protein